MNLDSLPTVDDFEDCFVNNTDLDRISGYLNRFNPIRIMRMESMEIRHSAILAWLLDPRETHGFDDKFLRAFLAQALRGQDTKHKPTALDVSQADLRDAEVRREKQNIDLFVASSSNGWAFVIENKFHSKQHSGQLKRYIEHAKKEAKVSGLEFQNRGIFLTLHQEDPHEEAKDAYVTLRYEAICTILENLLNGGGPRTSVEVRQFLSHYLEIIKDAAGMSDEQTAMEALAKELYLSHKKVLDFVMEHGATTEFALAIEQLFPRALKYGDTFDFEGVSYMLNKINDHRFSFLPVSWRDSLGGESREGPWNGCEKWWAGYPLICWFELYKADDGVKGSLRLFAEVGPLSDAECRDELIKGIKELANKCDTGKIQFGKSSRLYSKFLESSGNTVQIVDVSDSVAIEDGITRLFKKFGPTLATVTESLPKFMKYVEDRNG